jgi:hypothetical protein
MAAQVHITVVSCVLLISGCLASPQQPPTQSSFARTSSTPPMASEEVLVVGMGLGDALEMLTRHHIVFQMDGGGWEVVKQVAAAQQFVIEDSDIGDALVIFAVSESGETMRVRALYWWRNYHADLQVPKVERKRQYAHVKSIPMTEIERQFGPDNP